MNKFNVLIAATFAASSALVAGSASAQQSASNDVRSTGWFKTCTERDENKICNVQYRVIAQNNINIITLNLIEFTGTSNRRAFQIVVPTGRSLPKGIQMQVDGKRATVIPYLYCRPQACTAEVRLDDNLVGVFKKGGKLDIMTVNFQGKENPVPVTLKGFTAAFDGPPVKQEDPAAREKNLAEELKKKAEEERQKQESAD